MKPPPDECPLCGMGVTRCYVPRGHPPVNVLPMHAWHLLANHLLHSHKIPMGNDWLTRFMDHFKRGTLLNHLQEQQLIQLMTGERR